jgi:hypothetical protein
MDNSIFLASGEGCDKFETNPVSYPIGTGAFSSTIKRLGRHIINSTPSGTEG